MSAVDDILAQIPLSRLAGQLGTDEATAGAAARQAIPALLGGMQANAQDPAGAASLAGALRSHSAGLIDGGVDLDQVDADDGRKIVGNIFGAQTDGVAQTLGGNLGGGSQSELVKKLLPILAPIVMSYLVKRLGGGNAGGAGGGILGSILGSVLGGGAQSGTQPTSGGSVLDILGGLLGGGRR